MGIRGRTIAHGRAEIGRAILHRRGHRRRHAKQAEQVVVEASLVNVEQAGARSVGRVGGVDAPAGEAPDQPGIDGAENQLAARRPLPRARDVIENPGDFRRRKIGIEPQPGAPPHQAFGAAGGERLADGGGAPVLPDDRRMDRRAARPLPDQRRLALIGDADGGDVRDVDAGPRDRRAAGRDDARPDFFGVVLDMAGRRIMLRDLLLRARHGQKARIEQDGARRGGALIDRQHVFLSHRPLALVAHPAPGHRSWQTSTHCAPTSSARRSASMRTAALIAPAAGTTSPRSRSEASQ